MTVLPRDEARIARRVIQTHEPARGLPHDDDILAVAEGLLASLAREEAERARADEAEAALRERR